MLCDGSVSILILCSVMPMMSKLYYSNERVSFGSSICLSSEAILTWNKLKLDGRSILSELNRLTS